MSEKKPYYISTAIAYTSAKPHIGNTYEIVLADARGLVTVKVYNGETEVASVVESVESYIARKSTESPLFEYIMKFADSAYAYFHS